MKKKRIKIKKRTRVITFIGTTVPTYGNLIIWGMDQSNNLYYRNWITGNWELN